MNIEPNLELGVIGNCQISALIDRQASVVWSCFPRPDGDPVFHALVGQNADAARDAGVWAVELDGFKSSSQEYVGNSAVLKTTLVSEDGNVVDVIDFCPRFQWHGRIYRPQMIVRRIVPVAGRPRLRIVLRPAFSHGAQAGTITHGSNHVRYVGPEFCLRLTTSAPISYLLSESMFVLERTEEFLLGPDETLRDSVEKTARDFLEETEGWWRTWAMRLALPLEWQHAVLRAAITLKLCTFEDTGAILAAMTTSIPEAANTERNWDYRYCWLRDAFFVVRALNSLSEVETMENYLRFISNITADASSNHHLQPVFGITLEKNLPEWIAPLSGYRQMGPVRIGNQAHEHLQHDVYGNVVLAATQAFVDHRLQRPSGLADFERLERFGERAYEIYATPDASMWELRTRARVHTSSALMCWAACDRLARIANHLGCNGRVSLWQARAAEIREAIEKRAWNEKLKSFTGSFEGTEMDAGVLLMGEVGFLCADDPRFASTVDLIGRHLRRGDHLLRYDSADDFGEPSTAFNICIFWYIDALVRLRREDEARALFETVLKNRNSLGLLSEDIDSSSGELWGNYPQTYSLVGIINAAVRLSKPWERMI